MAKTNYLNVQGFQIALIQRNQDDFISLTDMARYKDNDPYLVIAHWMRIKNTIEYLGAWEILHNESFKPTEFGRLLNEAGSNRFMLTPQKWVESTNAIGVFSKSGKNGGTYAHKDIAYNFGMWLNPVFQLYITEDYLRLKAEEKEDDNWTAKRELARINYHIHTSAISRNLIPPRLTKNQVNFIYASEADVLNMALFGMTAKEWREQNPELQGNMRDYAEINQLICLSNLENINSVLIEDGVSQNERLEKLNQIAIHQMTILEGTGNKIIESH
ncbi:MAG: KilA-N domain-containing protein [Bacteroidaceae bacterium]|nr:KilA-N domain-containing protein [Bacteroidaceae bacterium]